MVPQKILALLAILLFSTTKTLADSATPTTRPGTMEFHVLADAVTANPADLSVMQARLQPGAAGPQFQPGDTIRWLEVEHKEEFDRPGEPPQTRQWNGKHYLLVLVSPDASMTEQSGKWGMEKAHVETMLDGSRAVGFQFDNAGSKLFGDLTTHWFNVAKRRTDVPDPHSRLAIVLDNKIISAPNLFTPITGGSGIINGGGKNGFTDQELDSLINSINRGSAGALPESSTSPGSSPN
jgi:hypothetical protein